MGIKIFYLDVLFRGAKFFQNLLELKSVVKVSDIATINIIYCHPKLSTLKVYRILTKILFHPFRQSFLFPRKIKKKNKKFITHSIPPRYQNSRQTTNHNKTPRPTLLHPFFSSLKNLNQAALQSRKISAHSASSLSHTSVTN